jgi:hypothetical protein
VCSPRPRRRAVKQGEHRGCDDRLLQRLRRHLHRLFDILRREGLVLERAAGQTRQLSVMPVSKDRKILPVRREIVGEPSPGQRVGERIGRKARHALLSVGDDGLARGLRALDRVEAGGVLFPFQFLVLDLAGVIVGERLLQLHRPGSDPTGSVGIGIAFLPVFPPLNRGWIVFSAASGRSRRQPPIYRPRALRPIVTTPIQTDETVCATCREHSRLSKFCSHWLVLLRPPNGKK